MRYSNHPSVTATTGSMQPACYGLANLLLLLLAGDVETNPGPPGRREPKPDPKKIMEEKVNSHDDKISAQEKLVADQAKLLEDMAGKQVELETRLEDTKVELEKAGAENKVLEESVGQLQVKLVEGNTAQVDLASLVQDIQVNHLDSQVMRGNLLHVWSNILT